MQAGLPRDVYWPVNSSLCPATSYAATLSLLWSQTYRKLPDGSMLKLRG